MIFNTPRKVLIVGDGLAGALMAWECQERGLDFEAGMDNSVDCAPHWEVIKRVCKSIAA